MVTFVHVSCNKACSKKYPWYVYAQIYAPTASCYYMHLSQIQRKYVFCHRPSPFNCVKSRRTKPIASWWDSVLWWTATFIVRQKNSWKGAISTAKNKTKLSRQILTSLESSSIEESEFNDVTWHNHVIILSTYIM